MRKHWLTLHGDTFLWLKENTGLVYNADKHTQFIFLLSDKITNLCQQLLTTTNLYTVELTDKDFQDDEINQWINSLISIQAGYLTMNVEFDMRPVSLKPILKVQDNKNYYRAEHLRGLKGKILQNLLELTFYINGSEHGNNTYFKQHLFSLKECEVLDSSKIQSFIKNSRYPFLSNINLVGNLFSYPDFEKLINDISDFSIPCKIHVMIKDFMDHIQQIKKIKWPSHFQFNLLVDSVFDVLLLKDFSLPFSITAFIFSEEDYMQFENLFESLPSDLNIRIIPLYNGRNLHFFESHVYIEQDEMDQIELSKNEIFIRQEFNTGDFGKLTIMPDGYVFANVNDPPLGTINNSPYSLVYREFTEGKSWLKIRDQAPCKYCIYQWLCPSPSNYETAIVRPNLCHIKQ